MNSDCFKCKQKKEREKKPLRILYYHIKLFISEELFEILEDMESLIYLFVYFSDNELQDEA